MQEASSWLPSVYTDLHSCCDSFRQWNSISSFWIPHLLVQRTYHFFLKAILAQFQFWGQMECNALTEALYHLYLFQHVAIFKETLLKYSHYIIFDPASIIWSFFLVIFSHHTLFNLHKIALRLPESFKMFQLLSSEILFWCRNTPFHNTPFHSFPCRAVFLALQTSPQTPRTQIDPNNCIIPSTVCFFFTLLHSCFLC